MLLKNIFLKTVRDYRWSILIWGGGLALVILANASAYKTLFAAADAGKQIADLQKISESFSFLVGKSYDLNTLGGYLTTRVGNITPVLLAIFALLAGSALIRGEEERGSLDLLLSTPHSRAGVLWQKWAGMATAIAAMCLLIWLGLLGGSASTKLDLDAGGAFLASLNVGLTTLIYGSLALVFGQLTLSRRAAASWTGGILAATYLMNSLSDSAASLNWLRYFSPFYYYNLSKPMAASVGVNWVGLLVLAIIPIPLVVVAVAMYLRRDHNSTYQLFNGKTAGLGNHNHKVERPKAIWLSNSFTFGLRAALPGAIIWGLSLSVYVVIIMSVFKEIRDDFLKVLSSNEIYKQLGFGATADNGGLLSVLLFVLLIVIVAAYAVMLVSGWTSEENEGRLELVLSTPQPRWQLLATRFAVALIAAAVMVGVVTLTFVVMSAITNVTLGADKIFAGFFGLWVVAVVIIAAGFGLAGFKPGWAVAVLSGLVILSYMTDLFGQVLKLPDWMVDLSVFHQYGQPVIRGIDWPVQLLLLGIGAVFAIGAALRFWKRDIVK